LSLPLFLAELFLITALIVRRGETVRQWIAPLFIFALFCFVLWGQFWNAIPGDQELPLLSGIVGGRFRIYVKLALYILLAGVAGDLARRGCRKNPIDAGGRFRIEMIPAVLVGLAAVIFLVRIHSIHEDRLKTTGEVPEAAYLHELWRYLKEHPGEQGTRIVYQGTYGNAEGLYVNRSHAFALSGLHAPIPQAGGWNAQWPYPNCGRFDTNAGLVFGRPEGQYSPEEIEKAMAAYNAGRMAVVSGALRAKLLGSNRFLEEKRFGPFSLLAAKAFEPSLFEPPEEVRCSLCELHSDRIEFFCETGEREADVVLKTAYHPYWRASAGDSDLSLEMDGLGRMRIRLPAGTAARISLRYDPRSYAGLAFSITICLFLVAIMLLKRH
jgi:hypothetical protein